MASSSRLVVVGVFALVSGLAGWPLDGSAAEARVGSMQAAIELEEAFAAVADQASPAVVVITNKQSPAVGPGPGSNLPPEFRFFFGIPEDQPPSRQRSPRGRLPRAVGKGSGVIVRPDGYLVTNYHVIKDNEALEVKLHDGRIFDSERNPDDVKVIGYDEETDLAVLQIGGGGLANLPVLDFADSERVRVGQWAIAVGAPFNFDYSVTVGVVSQKGRYDVRMNTYENYIQTDASINPGNSGGPLLNLRGEVIGINNFIVTGGGMSRGNVGLGFAIASNLVRQIVDDLIDSGSVIRPWMGIVMQAMDDDLRAQFGVDQGVLVSDVLSGDPADQAGLKPGDVILEVGGQPMNSPHDVQFAVLRYRPDDEIPVLVDRRGERSLFQVKVRLKDGTRGALAGAARGGQQDVLQAVGLLLEEQENQVVVAGVMSGGAADRATLLRGDIILEINRKPVSTIREADEALRATKGGVALVCRERQGIKQFVTLRLQNDDQ